MKSSYFTETLIIDYAKHASNTSVLVIGVDTDAYHLVKELTDNAKEIDYCKEEKSHLLMTRLTDGSFKAKIFSADICSNQNETSFCEIPELYTSRIEVAIAVRVFEHLTYPQIDEALFTLYKIMDNGTLIVTVPTLERICENCLPDMTGFKSVISEIYGIDDFNYDNKALNSPNFHKTIGTGEHWRQILTSNMCFTFDRCESTTIDCRAFYKTFILKQNRD